MKNDYESTIDALLGYMNDEVEQHGNPIESHSWDLNDGDDELNKISETTGLPATDLQAAAKICIARRLLKHSYQGGGQLGGLALTVDGQARAVSVKRAQNKPRETTPSTVHIGTFNSHAPAQIGNGNVMNIDGLVINLIQRIEAADATPKEKEEAKSMLKRFLDHPLVSAIVGSAAAALLA